MDGPAAGRASGGVGGLSQRPRTSLRHDRLRSGVRRARRGVGSRALRGRGLRQARTLRACCALSSASLPRYSTSGRRESGPGARDDAGDLDLGAHTISASQRRAPRRVPGRRRRGPGRLAGPPRGGRPEPVAGEGPQLLPFDLLPRTGWGAVRARHRPARLRRRRAAREPRLRAQTSALPRAVARADRDGAAPARAEPPPSPGSALERPGRHALAGRRARRRSPGGSDRAIPVLHGRGARAEDFLPLGLGLVARALGELGDAGEPVVVAPHKRGAAAGIRRAISRPTIPASISTSATRGSSASPFTGRAPRLRRSAPRGRTVLPRGRGRG
jgi:hypothetical protein